MGPPPAEKRQHLAVYDYGMGGVWVLIEAESAEAIERRYPQLQVITVGRPAWVTAEKYAELVNDISPQMRFDLEHPTGWLADGEQELSEPRPRAGGRAHPGRARGPAAFTLLTNW